MYQHAAATAYEHVLRLQNELPGVASLQQQLHGYLTAISCLELLRENDVSLLLLALKGDFFKTLLSFISGFMLRLESNFNDNLIVTRIQRHIWLLYQFHFHFVKLASCCDTRGYISFTFTL